LVCLVACADGSGGGNGGGVGSGSGSCGSGMSPLPGDSTTRSEDIFDRSSRQPDTSLLVGDCRSADDPRSVRARAWPPSAMGNPPARYAGRAPAHSAALEIRPAECPALRRESVLPPILRKMPILGSKKHACIERVLHFATALSCRFPALARHARFVISFAQWSVYLQPPP
jgi:hypothetical protein